MASGPPSLKRQCADPATFSKPTVNRSQTTGTFFTAPEYIEHSDTQVYNHFMTLAQSYRFFVQGTEKGAQSHCRFFVSRARFRHSNKRRPSTSKRGVELLARAGTLLARASNPTAVKGAAVADLYGTVYSYIAMCISCEICLAKRLALTLTPNHTEALYNAAADLTSKNQNKNMLRHTPYVDTGILRELQFKDTMALKAHVELWTDTVTFHKDVSRWTKTSQGGKRDGKHKHITRHARIIKKCMVAYFLYLCVCVTAWLAIALVTSLLHAQGAAAVPYFAVAVGFIWTALYRPPRGFFGGVCGGINCAHFTPPSGLVLPFAYC